MANHKQTPLRLDDPVSDYPDRQAGISWPLPVDAKLEQLLQTAREVAERTSRREIVAAIIAMDTNYTGDELSKLLRRYRLARVGDVLGQPDKSNVVPFIHRNSGPRTGGA
jgi:hypothetical protein